MTEISKPGVCTTETPGDGPPFHPSRSHYIPRLDEIHGFGLPRGGAGFIRWNGTAWAIFITIDPSRGYYFVGAQVGYYLPEEVIENVQQYHLPSEGHMRGRTLFYMDGYEASNYTDSEE